MLNRASILFIGAFAAVLMSYTALVLLPGYQLGTIEPTLERNDYTAREARGRAVYIREGCIYCHTQQVRPEGFGSDVARGWGSRGSLPADYVYDAPHLLGTLRTGPDLHDVGQRLQSLNWHMVHFYQPRAVSPGSNMPAYPYLFELRDADEVLPSEVTVPIGPEYRPRSGQSVVATQDALDLYTYLKTLKLNPADQAENR